LFETLTTTNVASLLWFNKNKMKRLCISQNSIIFIFLCFVELTLVRLSILIWLLS